MRHWLYPLIVIFVAAVTVGVIALLFNIRERQSEAKERFVKLVELDENTVDPKVWGRNFPRQYDSYLRTVDMQRSRPGGNEAIDKLKEDPRLIRLYAGYAFSKDYRERRGHAYMLKDQDETKRVVIVNQPGACLHCHASVMPTYRKEGDGDVMAGFKKVCGMDWKDARQLVDHPVSCVDCHDPSTVQLRITRPGFLNGIQTLAHYLADTRKAKEDEKRAEQKKPAKEQEANKLQGYRELMPHLTSLEHYAKAQAETPRDKRPSYDVNAEATRQELRSFVCGQCHVEYYFKKTEGNLLVYPWANGLKVEQIEDYYDSAQFADWPHKETGAKMLKAQHPEFELWNQGIHARSGVACADCHMPYKREGAVKISDHHVRSPLLNINRACQVCHRHSEKELFERADAIQNRTKGLLDRAENAVIDLISAIVSVKDRESTGAGLQEARALHRQAQWRLDFILAENSLGFHAPQESARILAEAIDFARQGQVKAMQVGK